MEFTQWDKKYFQEQPFMPFGTLVQGWARIKAQDPTYTIEQYKLDTAELFDVAKKMTSSTYKIVQDFIKKVEPNKSSTDIDVTT